MRPVTSTYRLPNEKEKVNETAQKTIDPNGIVTCGATEASHNGRFIWYQFTMRFYYSAWVALRGKMTPQLAAEALCTEFLYLAEGAQQPCHAPSHGGRLQPPPAQRQWHSILIRGKRGVLVVAQSIRLQDRVKVFTSVGCMGTLCDCFSLVLPGSIYSV
ncbi:hypothetical protein C3747_150g45 [Trypanosoma cruzi]|uniref:Uncharacterized protein n=1 Tax=Trypanosoma cruzi TaxID=5693 RepID=A0A2V2WCX0_TRYCR|nr:hypothetical protein C3747_150g45 [Trypanosoma cruzi]